MPNGILSQIQFYERPPQSSENTNIVTLGQGNQTGTVNKNKLNTREYSQAQEVVKLKGGHFEGQIVSNTPGIDGYLNGTPVSLKEYTGNSTIAILKHVSKSESQVANAGLNNVDVYISAKNVSMEAIIDFATKGPLVDIPSQGFISNIYILTADGWILIH